MKTDPALSPVKNKIKTIIIKWIKKEIKRRGGKWDLYKIWRV
jgi:hypothetical protein